MKKNLSLLISAIVLTLVGLYASSWAPRDLGSTTGRIPGHWSVSKAAGAGTDSVKAYYFAPLEPTSNTGRLIRVGEEGSQNMGTWRVVQDVPDKNRVRVELSGLDSARIVTLTLPLDGRFMTLGGPLGLMKAFSSELTYVNAETSPALFDPQEIGERVQMFR